MGTGKCIPLTDNPAQWDFKKKVYEYLKDAVTSYATSETSDCNIDTTHALPKPNEITCLMYGINKDDPDELLIFSMLEKMKRKDFISE